MTTLDSPEFLERVEAKRRSRMNRIDALPPEIRELIHEYGWTVVDAFMTVGVKNPRHIKHLVETTLNELSPTRGSFSSQGARSDARSWRVSHETA